MANVFTPLERKVILREAAQAHNEVGWAFKSEGPTTVAHDDIGLNPRGNTYDADLLGETATDNEEAFT